MRPLISLENLCSRWSISSKYLHVTLWFSTLDGMEQQCLFWMVIFVIPGEHYNWNECMPGRAIESPKIDTSHLLTCHCCCVRQIPKVKKLIKSLHIRALCHKPKPHISWHIPYTTGNVEWQVCFYWYKWDPLVPVILPTYASNELTTN